MPKLPALAAALLDVQALPLHPWERYCLTAAARFNYGDAAGTAQALGILCRMVADELEARVGTDARARVTAAITPPRMDGPSA